ncbi:hypothetical protein JYK22_17720, partial [Nonomuraea sp. RK-328]|nr:hypothetical protein [Nonomuraea sp. RK-328]
VESRRAGADSGRRIDWAAQLAACAVLALLTDALIAAGSRSWAHAAGAAAATALAARGFAALERRSDAPVLNRPLLGSGGGRAGLAAGAAVSFTLNGGLFVLPLLLTGTGVSLVLPALAAAVIAAAPEGTAGAAGGLLNAVRQTGATLGVAVMGACAGLGTVAGTALSLVVAAALCVLAAVWFALRVSP